MQAMNDSAQRPRRRSRRLVLVTCSQLLAPLMDLRLKAAQKISPPMECARDLQVRNYDQHAEEQRDGVEVYRPEGVVEAQGAERDHRRTAEEGDAGAVEPQRGDAAKR